MSRFAILFLGMLLAAAAQGAPFADPTQPPTVAAEPAGFPGVSPGSPRLESVLIAPDRRIAVINGQQVTVGARVGDGQVVRITESEVVIRGAERLETLKLFPELKRPQPAEKRAPQ